MQKNIEDLRDVAALRDANARLLSIIEEKDKELKERKNLNFVQMYKDEIKQLRGLVNLNATAFEILLILVEIMDKENAILISYSAMMQITKKSRQTCSKAIGDLQKSNFIKVIRSGSSNVYMINSNVFWTSDNQSKNKTATFNAKVFVTQEEQGENWKDVKTKKIKVTTLNGKKTLTETEKGEENE